MPPGNANGSANFFTGLTHLVGIGNPTLIHGHTGGTNYRTGAYPTLSHIP